MKNQPRENKEMSQSDLIKMRYDYAWKWFDFHAKQRTTMFNFFLIVDGVIANGIFTLMKEPKNELVAGGTSVLGLLVTLGFFVLEQRNRTLVDRGEEVLLEMEKSDFLWEDAKGKSILMREFGSDAPCWISQHKTWIPVIQFLVASGFLVLAYFNFKKCGLLQ